MLYLDNMKYSQIFYFKNHIESACVHKTISLKENVQLRLINDTEGRMTNGVINHANGVIDCAKSCYSELCGIHRNVYKSPIESKPA